MPGAPEHRPLAVFGWIGLKLGLTAAGGPAPDPYPLPFLALTVSVGGLLLAALIRIAQRRDCELATLRDQLTLELSLLGGQKTAKVIALLEAFRRSLPDADAIGVGGVSGHPPGAACTSPRSQLRA